MNVYLVKVVKEATVALLAEDEFEAEKLADECAIEEMDCQLMEWEAETVTPITTDNASQYSFWLTEVPYGWRNIGKTPQTIADIIFKKD